MVTAQELRKKYISFFQERGHALIPGAPLIPEHDPSVLFTTAGMHPLVPFLLGEKHPAGNRLVDVQKCVRTDDIDEVGDFYHHTFFEMLGNWSLGDPVASDGIGAGYFKKEAITWSWEFLTSGKWLGLKPDMLAVSVFAGDQDAAFDQEAYDAWKSLGVSDSRIARLPKKNNWWGPAGQTGPCGPDTEMFYWTGDVHHVPEQFDPDNSQWVEIWNDVFMQFHKQSDGTYKPLMQKNVDTGMGLERTLAVLNGQDDDYQTELFTPIVKKIEELSNKRYGDFVDSDCAMRIIADHIRAASFLMAEKLEPSNVEQGYILRRLVRRAVRYGKQIGIQGFFTAQIAQTVMDIYQDTYPELNQHKGFIQEQLLREEEKFAKTLERGVKIVKQYAKKLHEEPQDLGKIVFDLYQTYGFPLELTFEELKRNGVSFSSSELHSLFEEKLKHHQELSRAGAEQKFKGGLADHSEQTTKYHTATHVLQAALRTILGEHIEQRGSNITAARMRFDFPYPDKISQEQIKQIEDLVNEVINRAIPVMMQEMSLDEAKQSGALGLFASRYGKRVKVYTIGDFSKEICGGPHVANTKDIGHFTVMKVESIGQGLKRIRALVE